MTRFYDGRTDGQTDGVTRLLDLLSPLATQVKISIIAYIVAGDNICFRATIYADRTSIICVGATILVATRGPLNNWHSHRHLTPPLQLQPWKYMSAMEYIFFSYSPCAYRYTKEKFVNRKIYTVALVF